MCINGKMTPVETTPGIGLGGIKENGRMVEVVNSRMIDLIYCNLCKCHIVPLPRTMFKKNVKM
jgi:hypothetical protein